MARASWLLVGLCVFVATSAAGLYLSRHAIDQPDPDQFVHQVLQSARRFVESARYSDAIRVLHQVSDESAGAAEANLLAGIAYWKLNRWDAAEAAWKRALQIDPAVPEAAWHLLSFFFVQQRWQEAEELALDAYGHEPDPRDRTLLLLELVREDTERFQLESTVKALEPVVAFEPTNYHALRALGLSYGMLQRPKEGVTLIERAIAQRPEESEAWFSLVSCLYETGQMESLEQVWKRIPSAVLEEPRFQRYRGMWAEATADPVEAERAYRAVLEKDPADRKAHYQLARLLRGHGANQEAIEHENQAQRLDDAREQLALCYLKATQQRDRPSQELCHQFSDLCRILGRTKQAELWEQEALARSVGTGNGTMNRPARTLP